MIEQTGMPAEHALKMGLHPNFGQPTKLPTKAAQIDADPIPNGPLSTNYPIFASMLAEERKEAEYARYSCAQAERHARDNFSKAERFASELEMAQKENRVLRDALAKAKGRGDEWEERCQLWEQKFGHLISEHGEDYLA
jgi:hypothetical protein